MPVQPPERDSVAFAHTLQSDEASSMDAQGQAAHEQRRHQNKTDDSVIVMKDDDNGEKECDV